MINFGNLAHLKPQQLRVLQSANRGLSFNSKSGNFVMGAAPGRTIINFASALLPQLKVSPRQRNPLTPRPFGCHLGHLWFSTLTQRVETSPTIMRGGVARSLQKIEKLLADHADECVVLTTTKRLKRAARVFGLAVSSLHEVPDDTRLLIVDESHTLTRDIIKKLAALGPTDRYTFIVSPHLEASNAREIDRAMAILGLPAVSRGPVESVDFSVSEPRSCDAGYCCVCMDIDKRLRDVCVNKHRCCFDCSKRIDSCPLCRGEKNNWIIY